MKTARAMGKHLAHIPVSQLWEHSRHSRALEPEQEEHLAFCEDCVSVLWLCQVSQSLENVKAKLKEFGIDRDV
jgi:hypothetical protein